MEFQERGACHFHVLIDGAIDEHELKRMWYEIVGSGDPRHLKHGAHISPIRSLGGFKRYMVDYLTKEEQKQVPWFYENAGRFWGYSRSLVTVHIAVIVGSKHEIAPIRRNLRLFRRWQKARYRQHNKGRKKWKNKQINPYVNVMPGEYLFIADARTLIEKLKGTPYDSELFEDWGPATAEPAGPSPLTY